jgi:hypothetical protein
LASIWQHLRLRDGRTKRRVAGAEAELPLPAEEVWGLAKRTATQVYLSRKAFAYSGELPEVRQQGYEVSYRLRLFGIVPTWRHWQCFERVDERERELFVRERGGPYRVWNHRMRVEASGAAACRFVEAIEVEAGVLTPLVWLAARMLCRSRMRRLEELARVLA